MQQIDTPGLDRYASTEAGCPPHQRQQVGGSAAGFNCLTSAASVCLTAIKHQWVSDRRKPKTTHVSARSWSGWLDGPHLLSSVTGRHVGCQRWGLVRFVAGGVSQTASPVGPDQLPASPTASSGTSRGRSVSLDASARPAPSGDPADQAASVHASGGGGGGRGSRDGGTLRPQSPAAAAAKDAAAKDPPRMTGYGWASRRHAALPSPPSSPDAAGKRSRLSIPYARRILPVLAIFERCAMAKVIRSWKKMLQPL